ncbi:MAG: DMT family transporter [Flavobacteriaceae bacterium]|nr:DMT family transporter [Flavobacteriaceae bacterium]
MQNDKLRSALHFHFIVIIFGFTAILGALIRISAIPLVWYRMSLATIGLGLVLWIGKRSFRVSKTIAWVAILSGVLIAFHWVTFFAAVKASNVSITLSVLSSGAFLTSLLEPIFYKRKIIGYEVLFGLLVVVGLSMVLGTDTTHIKGFLYAGVSTVLAVLFTLLNGKYVSKTDPYILSFYELLVGAIVVTALLISQGAFKPSFFILSQTDILWLLILAFVCTSYAFVVSIVVMRHLSPYSIMLGINMEPVYGIGLAYVIFGEKEAMPTSFYIGLVCILVAVVANGVLKLKQTKKSKLTAAPKSN